MPHNFITSPPLGRRVWALLMRLRAFARAGPLLPSHVGAFCDDNGLAGPFFKSFSFIFCQNSWLILGLLMRVIWSRILHMNLPGTLFFFPRKPAAEFLQRHAFTSRASTRH